MKMEVPLWYRVSQKHLSYYNFEERFNSQLFNERENIALFVLASLYRHDPYLDGSHVLYRMIGRGKIKEKELHCFYLYSIFVPGSKDEVLATGIDRKLGHLELMVLSNFEEELEDLLKICLRAFLDLGYIQIPLEQYQPGNIDQLNKVFEYITEYDSRFKVSQKTTQSLYKVVQLHEMLIQFRDLLAGKGYPKYLQQVRHDALLFKKIVHTYSPQLLLSFSKGNPFTTEELKVIEEAQRLLYEKGNVEFMLYYSEQMKKLFGDSEVTRGLSQKSGLDQEMANQFLRPLSPTKRSKYLLQSLPVFDPQLDRVLRAIPEQGIETFLKGRVALNKRHFEIGLEQTGATLALDVTLSQESLYLYNPEDLIWHREEDTFYLFIFNEIEQLEGKNPYNRNRLPKEYAQMVKGKVSSSIEEMWTEILRRKIEVMA